MLKGYMEMRIIVGVCSFDFSQTTLEVLPEASKALSENCYYLGLL